MSRDEHGNRADKPRGRIGDGRGRAGQARGRGGEGRDPSPHKDGREHTPLGLWMTRERFLLLGVGALGAVALGRLFQLQFIEGPSLSAEALEARTVDVTLPAKRGSVYDRNGEVLATTVSAKQVVLNPSVVAESDKATLAQTLANTLGGDLATYVSALAKSTSQYQRIARHVDTDTAAGLEDITGVEITDDPQRVYPYEQIAGQVIGVTDTDGIGIAGLELQYEDVLSGTDGSITYERGENGQLIPGGVSQEVPAQDGQDIIVSIDLELQQYVETCVAATVEEYSASSGLAVVLDASNGEVLACASTPYLNAADFSTASQDAFRLKAVTDVYEPGSVFKCFTAAALLGEGALSADTVIDVPSSLSIDGYTVSDMHAHGDEELTFRQVMEQSSNIGITNASHLISRTVLDDYYGRFGLMSSPGVDYPGATKGISMDVSQWSDVRACNITFGQGISVSALQVIRGIATIANEGVIETPHFLIDMPHVDSYQASYEESEIITTPICTALTDILVSVVTDGTGTPAAMDGYTVAGKTGTAQVATSTGYSSTQTIASFVGWLPRADCDLVCLVVIDDPNNTEGGGIVAAPTFKEIMTFACDRYKVAPDLTT